MSITVKKLITELEKIENKFLEVEICVVNDGFKRLEAERIAKSSDRKVLIFATEKNDG